jgi:hypothetical protein
MGKIKNKSSYEPGIEIVFCRTEQCDLKIKFGTNECPMVYLVQVICFCQITHSTSSCVLKFFYHQVLRLGLGLGC